MKDDFDNGMGLPEDELTGGSTVSDPGDLGIGGMDADDEMDSEAPGRPSGGARARKTSPPKRAAAAPAAAKSAKKSAGSSAKKKSAKKAPKKAAKKKSAKKSAGARKASRKPAKASKKAARGKKKAGRRR